MRVLLLVACFLLPVPAAEAAVWEWLFPPRQYSYPGAEAQVVDAETGQPLEGVFIFASWPLMTWFHGGSLHILQVDHAMTDGLGHFRLSPWGPLRPPSGEYLPSGEQVKAEWPNFYTFKAGYVMEKGLVRPGLTIRLKPFRGSDAEWLEELKPAAVGGWLPYREAAAFARHYEAAVAVVLPELQRLAARYPPAAEFLREHRRMLELSRKWAQEYRP